MGLFEDGRGERAALASVITGVTLWLIHYLADWESFLSPWLDPHGVFLPVSLSITSVALLAYLVGIGKSYRQKPEKP